MFRFYVLVTIGVLLAAVSAVVAPISLLSFVGGALYASAILLAGFKEKK